MGPVGEIIREQWAVSKRLDTWSKDFNDFASFTFVCIIICSFGNEFYVELVSSKNSCPPPCLRTKRRLLQASCWSGDLPVFFILLRANPKNIWKAIVSALEMNLIVANRPPGVISIQEVASSAVQAQIHHGMCSYFLRGKITIVFTNIFNIISILWCWKKDLLTVK